MNRIATAGKSKSDGTESQQLRAPGTLKRSSIVIDFDLVGEDGEKDLEANLARFQSKAPRQ